MSLANPLLLSFLAVLLAGKPGFGQGAEVLQLAVPKDHPTRFNAIRFTQGDGLPVNAVDCLLQSRDGILWVGTTVGLARSDGIRFISPEEIGQKGLDEAPITSLAEDPHGRLWIGTIRGIRVVEGDRVRFLGASVGIPESRVYTLFVSDQGDVWAGFEVGLWRVTE